MEHNKSKIMDFYISQNNESDENEYEQDINKILIEILNLIELNLLSNSESNTKDISGMMNTVEKLKTKTNNKLLAMEDVISVLKNTIYLKKKKFEKIVDEKLKDRKISLNTQNDIIMFYNECMKSL